MYKKYLKYKTKYNYIKNQLIGGGKVSELVAEFEKRFEKRLEKPFKQSLEAPVEALVEAPVKAPDEPSLEVSVKPQFEKPFETNIINENIKVVSLSDIHGDIHSFIISLRDCAQVIRKKTEFNFATNEADNDMEQLLQRDIDTDELKATYTDDLNYEWCGGNTHVVICGDIIDPYRTSPYLPICRKIETKKKKKKKKKKERKEEGDEEGEGAEEEGDEEGDEYEDEDYKKDEDDPDDPYDPYEAIEENQKLIPCEYYPQIELKILWFINAINKQIIEQNKEGKIIKLVGNHDLSAIIDDKSYTYIYAFPTDLKKKNYYSNIKRKEIFKVGNPGFNFLVEGGIGILVKINSTIFVHGDLVETYNTYNDLNQFMNDESKRELDKWKNMFSRELDYNRSEYDLSHEKSSLLSRNRGNNDNKAYKRIDNPEEQLKYCNELKESFLKFRDYSNSVLTELTDDVNNLKLVIGHCIQSRLNRDYYNREYVQNRTYKLISDEKETTAIVETYGVKTYVGKPNKKDRSTIVGITMECKIEDEHKNTKLQKYDLYQLYRIDIGSSRGQDSKPYKYITNTDEENLYLYSKTPQVLEINTDGTVKIKKSTIGNTRRYLRRPNYEALIKDIDELKLTHQNYNKKYLKYKNKYLQLKQIIK
jgi:hypothetical protein